MQSVPFQYVFAAAAVGSAFLIYSMLKRRKLDKIGQNHFFSSQMKQPMPIQDLIKKYSEEFNNSKTMEKIIPRQFTKIQQLKSMTSNLLYLNKQGNHLQSLSKSLSTPIWDLLDRGGKRWRPILCMLIAQLYGYPKQKVFDVAAMCEIIHNGTLIIDDIQDNSLKRRNKECLHLLYGIDLSINAGNFMYFAPLSYLLKRKDLTPDQVLKIGQVYTQQMTQIHIGQGLDLFWHKRTNVSNAIPSEEQFLQMVAFKTGALTKLSTKLTGIILNLPQKQIQLITKFAQAMGVAFQIQDDLLNLQKNSTVAEFKALHGQDIIEGKLTLMMIYYLNKAKEQDKTKILSILGRKKQTYDSNQEMMECIDQVIEALDKEDSLKYARMKMYQIMDEAWNQVNENLPNNIYKQYLHDLSYFGLQRKK